MRGVRDVIALRDGSFVTTIVTYRFRLEAKVRARSPYLVVRLGRSGVSAAALLLHPLRGTNRFSYPDQLLRGYIECIHTYTYKTTHRLLLERGCCVPSKDKIPIHYPV